MGQIHIGQVGVPEIRLHRRDALEIRSRDVRSFQVGEIQYGEPSRVTAREVGITHRGPDEIGIRESRLSKRELIKCQDGI